MVTHAKLVRVAIASPGDVDEIRDRIPKIFNQWNAAHPDTHISPVMWETHSVPAMGDHPQHILNQQIIEQSDLLIAIFWQKIGTPTPTAASGTIEEIEEFITRKGPSRAMVYFFNHPVPTSPADINLSQIQALQEFKRVVTERSLYQNFQTIQEFESLIYRHLDNKVPALLSNRIDEPPLIQRRPELKSVKSAATSGLKADDFGVDLETIAAGFSSRAKDFVRQGGCTTTCYLDLGANVWNAVAGALDRWLARSWQLPADRRYAIEQISKRLKRLAQDSPSYLKKGFNKFWDEGLSISEELDIEVRYQQAVGK